MSREPSARYREDRIGKVYDHRIISRMLSYLSPYLFLFGISICMAFVVTGAELARPYLVKVVIDQYITPAVQTNQLTSEQAFRGIWLVGGGYLGLLFLQFFCMYLQNYFLYDVGQNVMRDLREQVFETLLHLPVQTLEQNPTGRLVTRVTNDVEAINKMYSEVLVALLKDLIMVGGLLTIMLVTDWKLTLIILLLAPVAYVISRLFGYYVREAYRLMRRKVAELNAYLDEHLSGMEIIKAFAQEDRTRKEFNVINEEEYQSRMEQLKIYGVFRPLVHLMRIVATALVLWVGGFQVIQHAVSIGTLVLFLSYVEKLFKPLRELAQKYDVLQRAMASAERIFDVLDKEPESNEGEPVPEVSSERTGHKISFENVWFRYDPEQEREQWTLKDVSFTVKPGEQVAVVGPTGAGKTTIFKLLLRWYDVQRGYIRLNGRDISTLKRSELRKQFGVVFQDGVLFSEDVLNNIRMLSEDVSLQCVRETARKIGVESHIMSLPDGYETRLHSGGEQLSEGQRQYLALARALVHEPDVLLFDEATASMDTKTETELLSALQQYGYDRTSITIAHRLSTIRESDRIFVLDEGEIVERGDHADLLSSDGLYASLYALQTRVNEWRTSSARD